jgi:hypothetical protein
MFHWLLLGQVCPGATLNLIYHINPDCMKTISSNLPGEEFSSPRRKTATPFHLELKQPDGVVAGYSVLVQIRLVAPRFGGGLFVHSVFFPFAENSFFNSIFQSKKSGHFKKPMCRTGP